MTMLPNKLEKLLKMGTKCVEIFAQPVENGQQGRA
jgi:hypothetical protein